MKKLLIITIMFMFGVCATQAFGQISVNVLGRSVLVNPPAHTGVVYVPHYYLVQPKPYVVTPYVKLPPPKPQFRTPFRNKLWRKYNRPQVYYYVRPYKPEPKKTK